MQLIGNCNKVKGAIRTFYGLKNIGIEKHKKHLSRSRPDVDV